MKLLKDRLAERRRRHSESLRAQEMLLAKEVAYRRQHGMRTPDYLLPRGWV